MNYINNIIFQQRAKKYLSLTPRKHKFVNYSKAKSVLIVFESEQSEKNDSIHSIIKTLQQDGKKVISYGYVHKKLLETKIMPDFRIFNQKQTDFFCMPNQSIINEIKGQEFDLLLDLTVNQSIPLQYLVMYAKANCKAGSMKNDLEIFDFVIDLGGMMQQSESTSVIVSEMYLYNQIIFYLKSIQTND